MIIMPYGKPDEPRRRHFPWNCRLEREFGLTVAIWNSSLLAETAGGHSRAVGW